MKRLSKFQKFIAIAVGFLSFIPMGFLNANMARESFLLLALAVAVVLGVSALTLKRNRGSIPSLLCGDCLLFISFFATVFLVMESFDYTYPGKVMPFLIPSLVIAAAIAAAFAAIRYYQSKNAEHSEKTDVPLPKAEDGDTPEEKTVATGKQIIAVSFVSAFILSLFVVHTLLMHMNFLFDNTEPKTASYVITDKRDYKPSRGGKRYYLTVDLGSEKLELLVPHAAYNEYDVGETYAIMEYRGAFDEPFYLGSEE